MSDHDTDESKRATRELSERMRLAIAESRALIAESKRLIAKDFKAAAERRRDADAAE